MALRFKRAFDLLIAVPTLVVMSLPMAVIAIAIAVKMGRPVLFKQTRPGYREKPFVLMKFRTMRDAIDASGRTLTDAERVTKFGVFLRRTSLDELPQLLNICKGDLSLVGPRPLLMEYLPRYSSEQRRRHNMKPGLTGWAQVNGRNAISWEDTFALDVWYVDHWSLWLDFKILVLTLFKVVRRQNTTAQGMNPTLRPYFLGSSDTPSTDIEGSEPDDRGVIGH